MIKKIFSLCSVFIFLVFLLFSCSPVVNAPTSYTVKFVDYDNTVLATRIVEKHNAALAPANPNRIGYAFSMWDKDFSFVKSDLIVKAQYSILEYSITFNENGGSSFDVSVFQKTYSIESKEIKLPVSIKEGCVFEGWYETSTLVGQPVTSIPSGSTGHKTYYAKWKTVFDAIWEHTKENGSPLEFGVTTFYMVSWIKTYEDTYYVDLYVASTGTVMIHLTNRASHFDDFHTEVLLIFEYGQHYTDIYIHFFYRKSGGVYEGTDNSSYLLSNGSFNIIYDEHNIPYYFVDTHSTLANSSTKLAIALTRLYLSSYDLDL